MKFKKIREKLLVIFGAVIGLFVIWFCVYLVIFLIEKFEQSLAFQPQSIRATEFDTEGFEKLNLIQEKQLEIPATPKPIVPKEPKVEPPTSIPTSTPPAE